MTKRSNFQDRCCLIGVADNESSLAGSDWLLEAESHRREVASRQTVKERRCLIGVADNESSLATFDFYADHIHRADNKVVLVHVVEPHVYSTNQSVIHRCGARQKKLLEEKQTVKILQQTYEERMRQSGIEGRINIIYYSTHVGKVLCQVAKEEHCSMILLAAPMHGTNSSPLQPVLGDVIEYVLKKSKCPVIIYQQESEVLSTSSKPTPLKLLKQLSLDAKLKERQKTPKPRTLSLPDSELLSTASSAHICDQMSGWGLMEGMNGKQLVNGMSTKSDDKPMRARRHTNGDVHARHLRKNKGRSVDMDSFGEDEVDDLGDMSESREVNDNMLNEKDEVREVRGIPIQMIVI